MRGGKRWLIVAVAAAAALSGCGQKGALILPDRTTHSTTVGAASSAPASTVPAASNSAPAAPAGPAASAATAPPP
ncbi:MAG: lipoprotein [Gammaproteobacteria bacterium]|nr:lipoprotein [Gammaproteobacteria bacterium]MDE2306402.1 lipoprotein [Gammaproteobacteria bacterium]